MDVEQLPTHGGSLRVWLAHDGAVKVSSKVEEVLLAESSVGLETPTAYIGLQQRAEAAKNSLLEFLLQAKQQGRVVLGYGAAAKGNTLLNYAGVRADLLPSVVDRASSKQGKFLPGSHIPVISPDKLATMSYDTLLILPWNLINEVRQYFVDKHLVTAIPVLTHWNGKS